MMRSTSFNILLFLPTVWFIVTICFSLREVLIYLVHDPDVHLLVKCGNTIWLLFTIHVYYLFILFMFNLFVSKKYICCNEAF